MSNVTAKRFEYRASLYRDGTIRGEGAQALAPDASWTPEALVLTGLARCVLTSLAHYARGVEIESAAEMWSLVSLREADGRFAMLETTVDLDVTLAPEPPSDRLPTLLAQAEAGCFVGNSLTPKPSYRWTVNGHPVAAATR